MGIGAFAFTRLLVFIRRLYKSVDRLADIEQKRLDLELELASLHYPGQYKRAAKSIKMTEIGQVDVEELNKQWKLQHPEM